MKRISLISLLSLASFSYMAQYSNKTVVNRSMPHVKTTMNPDFKPLKMLHSAWDTISNAWDLEDSTIYSYNTAGKVTKSVFHSLTSNFKEQYTYTYDMNQNEAEKLGQSSLNGSALENSDRTSKTYNTNNKILTQTLQFWNQNLNLWKNINMETYNYNANNQATEIIYQRWNVNGSYWENESKDEFNLNASGQATLALFYSWSNNAWKLSERLTNITWYQWNSTIYDSDVLSAELQEWNGSVWQNVEKVTHMYDASGNQTQELTEQWNGTMYVFEDKNTSTYFYDPNNNVTENVYKTWFSHLNALRNYDKYDYSRYTDVSVGLRELKTAKALSIFPNPVKNSATIYSPEATTVQVYNLLGKLIMSQAIPQGTSTLDMEAQPKGMYMLCDKEKTIKFIKE